MAGSGPRLEYGSIMREGLHLLWKVVIELLSTVLILYRQKRQGCHHID